MGQGNDYLSFYGTVNHVGNLAPEVRIYMGEGSDELHIKAPNNNSAQLDYGYLGHRTNIYMESGDDTVSVAFNVSGKLYTGSGSDNIKVSGSVTGLVDLGSGNTLEDYQAEYADGSGLSLGNDNNIDSETDINILQVGGSVSGSVISGNGEDRITVDGRVSGVIDTGSGLDTVNVAGNVNGNIYTRDGKDEVNVTGNVVNGFVSTGNDDDIIIIGGNVGQTDLVESKSYVDGGAGNDYIRVKGNVINERGGSRSKDPFVFIKDAVLLKTAIVELENGDFPKLCVTAYNPKKRRISNDKRNRTKEISRTNG